MSLLGVLRGDERRARTWASGGRAQALHGLRLAGKNLSRVDLSRADLSQSDLSHATMEAAHLTGAVLREVNLVDASLTGAGAGGRMNYYYFGFVMVGALIELTRVVPVSWAHSAVERASRPVT